MSRQRIFSISPTNWVREPVDELDRLVGGSSSVSLDHRAQTLTFVHHGSVATDEQKAQSPVVVPLGSIATVECRAGRSTNWFWVTRRGCDPWRDGVWSDPCGVVSRVDPTDFAERVKSAARHATPIADVEATDPAGGSSAPSRWRSRLAKGIGRAVVDGFFNTR